MCPYVVCNIVVRCETWSLILKGESMLRRFESGVLRRIFGPERDHVTGEWRKLHNEELHDLYFSSTILRVIKSRIMRWVGHVARIGRREACTGFWWGNPRERDQWGGPGVDGRIILRWIFRKWDVGVWTGLSWLRIETGGGTCECRNKLSGSIKCGK
jgi:hypothetical protein